MISNDSVHIVRRQPHGLDEGFGAFLVNPDFAAWMREEGIWEIRSHTALRAEFFRWKHHASARTRDDAVATLEAILKQERAMGPSSTVTEKER